MTKDWLKGKLARHIRTLPMNGVDVEVIILDYHPDGAPAHVVPVDAFVAHFGHVPEVANRSKLMAEDKGKGYGPYFDRWQAEGLISE